MRWHFPSQMYRSTRNAGNEYLHAGHLIVGSAVQVWGIPTDVVLTHGLSLPPRKVDEGYWAVKSLATFLCWTVLGIVRDVCCCLPPLDCKRLAKQISQGVRVKSLSYSIWVCLL